MYSIAMTKLFASYTLYQYHHSKTKRSMAYPDESTCAGIWLALSKAAGTVD